MMAALFSIFQPDACRAPSAPAVGVMGWAVRLSEVGRPAVGSFGERMRREREMRSITVEEIAEATKIGSRSLRALEDEKLDQLPGGIFNRGFVRAYARYLGIDEEQAVADYMAAENTYQQAHGVPTDAVETS